MKLKYRLSHMCGNVFENGNLVFTPDGNSVISPIGNRVTVFDLVNHSSYTFPFENKKNIKRICISHDGRFLITIDIDGHSLFINFPRKVILHRHHFKRKVHEIQFSPNDEYFAVSFGHGCQIWKTPGLVHEFSPLTLCRALSGHHDDVVCLDWSPDSKSLVLGSKDLSARVYYSVNSKKMALTVLSGHRDELVAIFYSKDANSIYSIARDGAIFTWIFDVHQPGSLKPHKRRRNIRKTSSSRDLSDNETDDDNDNESVEDQDSQKRGTWKLDNREFLWEPHTTVTSAGYNRDTGLLVIGFDQGVFGLYELNSSTGLTNLQRLSVSSSSLNTCCINNTGEWLALGSAKYGQLLVWEWKSESYVLKQQGHVYGLSSIDFSDDGQYIVTGGEDSKVKLWNASSGFCFSTFSEHIAPVTGVRFLGKGAGKAVISCSLDGTVRAHDLLRYRNFRTLTTPSPVQFTCVAVDRSGEIVCAGSLDPFNIYVWTLQTSQLLDVLAGHEGPIACLEFSPGSSGSLASGSWDGTLKLWDIYNNSNVETMEHGCDVLAVAIRPDGKEVCTATTNGNLTVWDVETGAQIRIIEGRRDIAGGRLTSDLTTAANSARAKHFTCVTYSSDGTCVLAGGKSKFVCIYSIAMGTLLKKFTLSHNKSLEGVLDELRSDRLVDGIPVDNLPVADSDSDGDDLSKSRLPGAAKGASKDGTRTVRPDIRSSAVRFSPTGRQWAVASTQGLLVYGLDEGMIFAPTDIDSAVTPQTITAAISRHEYGLALNMALHLGEPQVLKTAVDSVAIESVELVVRSVDVRMLQHLIRFLAEEVAKSLHLEYYLVWCKALLQCHHEVLQKETMSMQESLRAMIRAVSIHDKLILKMAEENQYLLSFLVSQLPVVSTEDQSHSFLEEGAAEAYDGTVSKVEQSGTGVISLKLETVSDLIVDNKSKNGNKKKKLRSVSTANQDFQSDLQHPAEVSKHVPDVRVSSASFNPFSKDDGETREEESYSELVAKGSLDAPISSKKKKSEKKGVKLRKHL